MKKGTLIPIIGAASVMTVSYGQGKINLNNYTASGNQIVYGSGANAISGTTVGHGISNGPANGSAGSVIWTIGFYYALGDVTAGLAADATGVRDPSTLGGGLAFATGVAGDTTTISSYGGGNGYFASAYDAIINGWTAGVVTFEVVAYIGAEYGNSLYRGHSAAFLFTPIASTSGQGAPNIGPDRNLGIGMPGFSVFAVPEPSTFALAGLGAAALMAFRRKK